VTGAAGMKMSATVVFGGPGVWGVNVPCSLSLSRAATGAQMKRNGRRIFVRGRSFSQHDVIKQYVFIALLVETLCAFPLLVCVIKGSSKVLRTPS